MNKKYSCILLLISIMLILLPYPTMAVDTTPPNLYVVQTGDTLPSIAKRYNISNHELKITNGLQSDSLIKGQKLWVPVTYEVTTGENLEAIAWANNSTVQTIKETNNLTSNHVYPGQILTIKPKKMNMNGQHILMNREEFKDWLFNQQITRDIQLIQ